jgi:hypothetical protein
VQTRIPVPPASSCGHCQPHFVGNAHAVHSLQEKLQVETELHFYDSQPQWFAIADRDSVTAGYLALHNKSSFLKEALHNWIERGLRHVRNLRRRPASQQVGLKWRALRWPACEGQIGTLHDERNRRSILLDQGR